MRLVTIPPDEIEELKALWDELNEHHLRESLHFKAWFRDYSFEKHLAMRVRGKESFAQAVEEGGAYVAFCLTTLDSIARGEIDSIFVREAHRGSGFGRLLMESALAWLKERKAVDVSISSAGGNEAVFGFYAKCGFYPSGHLLRAGDDQ